LGKRGRSFLIRPVRCEYGKSEVRNPKSEGFGERGALGVDADLEIGEPGGIEHRIAPGGQMSKITGSRGVLKRGFELK
jgi:hypothetical protein